MTIEKPEVTKEYCMKKVVLNILIIKYHLPMVEVDTCIKSIGAIAAIENVLNSFI